MPCLFRPRILLDTFMLSTPSPEIPIWQFFALLGTGTVAGFVDAIAGGGGLISLPVLINLGIADQDALGTNKLQAMFGTGSATWRFSKAELISFKDWKVCLFWTFGGAGLGAIAVQQINPSFLKHLIPVLLVMIALYSLLSPKLGLMDQRKRISQRLFSAIFGLGLGFYDGFFGPGAGNFWAMAFMLFMGFNMIKATAHAKVMNLASGVASFIFFSLGNHVFYLPGLVMGFGQLIGARLGAKMAIKRGAPFIRPIFITVVLAITAKLLYQNYK
jgi:uncharacterized protein